MMFNADFGHIFFCGRRGIKITSAQILTLALMMCAVTLVGCLSSEKAKTGGNPKPQKEIPATASEKRKAKLLKDIDRKFENPEAHFELGKIYQAERMWSQAENEYNAALSFAPANKGAQAGLVKVIIEGGDKDKASNYADLYKKQVFSSAVGSYQLGRAFEEQGLDDYALSCYKQALHLTPDSYKVNRQIGYYYLNKGDKEQAKIYLSRSFQVNSDQSDVAGELGKLGVPVKIPPKTKNSGKELDKMDDQTAPKKK